MALSAALSAGQAVSSLQQSFKNNLEDNRTKGRPDTAADDTARQRGYHWKTRNHNGKSD
jgi:hypothetical protein